MLEQLFSSSSKEVEIKDFAKNISCWKKNQEKCDATSECLDIFIKPTILLNYLNAFPHC